MRELHSSFTTQIGGVSTQPISWDDEGLADALTAMQCAPNEHTGLYAVSPATAKPLAKRLHQITTRAYLLRSTDAGTS